MKEESVFCLKVAISPLRSMHVAATRKDEEEFITQKDRLSRVLCEFWDVHDSLSRVHQTTRPSSAHSTQNLSYICRLRSRSMRQARERGQSLG